MNRVIFSAGKYTCFKCKRHYWSPSDAINCPHKDKKVLPDVFEDLIVHNQEDDDDEDDDAWHK